MTKTKIGLMALFAGLTVGNVLAADFTNYQTGDVIIGFRNGGTYNIVVNAGQVSVLTNAAPNKRISINALTSAQLTSAFGGADSLNWSAFTWTTNGATTLFMTRPRANINSKSSSWNSQLGSLQAGVALNMSTIPVGASYIYGKNAAISPSTAGSVIEPQSPGSFFAGQSYYTSLFGGLSSPTFGGLFQGNPENSTPGNFSTSGTVVRSDFYQIPPGPGGNVNVKWLGYFELNSNGGLTYVAYPSSTPVLKSISRTGDVSTISYVTGLYGTYTLRATNTLAYGVSTNWPAVSVLASGDTAVHTAVHTSTETNLFYTITAE